MIRATAVSLLLSIALLGGCASPKQASYSCRQDLSNRNAAPVPAQPPHKDSGGDYTCE